MEEGSTPCAVTRPAVRAGGIRGERSITLHLTLPDPTSPCMPSSQDCSWGEFRLADAGTRADGTMRMGE